MDVSLCPGGLGRAPVGPATLLFAGASWGTLGAIVCNLLD